MFFLNSNIRFLCTVQSSQPRFLPLSCTVQPRFLFFQKKKKETQKLQNVFCSSFYKSHFRKTLLEKPPFIRSLFFILYKPDFSVFSFPLPFALLCSSISCASVTERRRSTIKLHLQCRSFYPKLLLHRLKGVCSLSLLFFWIIFLIPYKLH